MADQSDADRRYPEELRGAIDSGRTGDKVAYPDPAAAPLGTDDEAAGVGPPPWAVRQALERETARPASAEAVSEPEGWTLSGAPATGLAIAIVLAVLMMMYYIVTHIR